MYLCVCIDRKAYIIMRMVRIAKEQYARIARMCIARMCIARMCRVYVLRGRVLRGAVPFCAGGAA